MPEIASPNSNTTRDGTAQAGTLHLCVSGRRARKEFAMKKLLLTVAVLAMVSSAANTQENDPPPPRFQPWQQIWQCNDVRVTITARDPFSVEYDLGGMIWGGSRFTVIKGELFVNGRPCLPLRPVGY